MKAFVVMPFASVYDSIWNSIQKACNKTGINPIRADKIQKIGPIINQIFRSIEDADIVIAEISDANQNVYYEVGISHSMKKPTILLARKKYINNLPFDIRHNRVVSYEIDNPENLINELFKYLKYLKESLISKNEDSKVDSFLNSLNFTGETKDASIKQVVDYIGKNFGLIDPILTGIKMTSEGSIITVRDAFKEEIVALVDVNGIIKRVQKTS